MTEHAWSAARAGDRSAFDALVAEHERALVLFAYHLTGSVHDAHDVAQEAFLRAWSALATFAGTGTFRGWLRRIAANVVIDRNRSARRRPEVVGLPWDPATELPAPEGEWVEPFPDGRLPAPGPEHEVATAQSLELAFLGLLQRLPPRQRAVYVLRELWGSSASETAEALGMTDDAVKSALSRARSALGVDRPSPVRGSGPERALAARYARAWATRDLDTLLALLTDDVVVAMPPYAAWLSGREAVRTFALRHLRVLDGPPWGAIEVGANLRPAIALYRPVPDGGAVPFGLMLLTPTPEGDAVCRLDAYVLPELLPTWFELPPRLDASLR